MKLVTTYIRFHDISQLDRLDRCVFSLSLNSQETSVKILTQNFNETDTKTVNLALQKYPMLESEIINVTGALGEDLRTKLLNKGIESCDTMLCHFVDYDDLVFQGIYKKIIKFVNEDKAKSIIYFFRVCRAFSNVYSGYDYMTFMDKPWVGKGLQDLMVENFCPLHSYVLNMKEVKLNKLRYDETYEVLEDYDFLLRASTLGQLSFRGIDEFIGIYNFRNDSTNTTILNGSLENDLKKNKWVIGREKINKLKKRLVEKDHQALLGE